jgi:hypothetical protein
MPCPSTKKRGNDGLTWRVRLKIGRPRPREVKRSAGDGRPLLRKRRLLLIASVCLFSERTGDLSNGLIWPKDG